MELTPLQYTSSPLRALKRPSQKGNKPSEKQITDSFAPSKGSASAVDPRQAMEIVQEYSEGALEEIWRSKPIADPKQVIDASSDRIYINRWTSLEACSASDGHRLWNHPLNDTEGGLNCIALGKNNTLVASTNQAGPEGDGIFAIDQNKGGTRWSKKARKKTFFEGIAVGQDGRIFVGNSAYSGGPEDRIVALNGDTGQIEWQFTVGDRLQAEPLLGPGNSVLFGCRDNNLYSMDRTSGKKRWAFDSGGPIAITPVYGPDGTVVFINTEGVITAIDATTGEKKWTGNTGGERGFTSGTLVCSPDGTIFAVNNSTETSLWAFDGKSGTVLWSKKTDHWVQADPLVDAEGNFYIGTRDPGEILIYDGKTGGEKEKIKVGDLIESLSSDQKKESIYCGTSEGRVIAFKKRHPEALENKIAKEKAPNPEIITDDEVVSIDHIKIPIKKD